MRQRITDDDEYFRMIRERWSEALREAYRMIPRPPWAGQAPARSPAIDPSQFPAPDKVHSKANVHDRGSAAMRLTSGAFADGKPIPERHTCDGANLSPPLQWAAVPAATRSLVLLCDDPDAPAGTWHHWAIYDIAADRRSLPEDAAGRGDAGLHQAVNDFRKPGYGGPCPPSGHGLHRYHFRLLALDVTALGVRRGASCREVEQAARQHLIAEATLIGVYQR